MLGLNSSQSSRSDSSGSFMGSLARGFLRCNAAENLRKYVPLPEERARKLCSGGVRVQFCVRVQVVKVPIFGGFPPGKPTNKAIASKLF